MGETSQKIRGQHAGIFDQVRQKSDQSEIFKSGERAYRGGRIGKNSQQESVKKVLRDERNSAIIKAC